MINNDVLSGITVVDISQNLPGPYCAYLLQKMGATVLKIESEKKTDPAKYLPDFYETLNGKKKILNIDFTTENGLKEFYHVVKHADVIIEGARPGVAKKLKIDVETLSQYKSDLIYCSITGYGQNSLKHRTPAHDLNLQAESGLLTFFKAPKDSICVIPIADFTASHKACTAVLSALIARGAQQENRAEPIFIDISMGNAIGEMVEIWKTTIPTNEQVDSQLDKFKLTNIVPKLNPIRNWIKLRTLREPLSSIPHYDVFKCKDKRWIALGIVDEQHFWEALCEEFGGLFLRLKPLKLQQRIILSPILKSLISRKIASKEQQYWLSKLSLIPISSLKGNHFMS